VTTVVPLACIRDHAARGRHVADPCDLGDECTGCRPALAEVGVLCGSCAARVFWAVDEAPDVLAHLRAQIVPDSIVATDRERVSGSSSARLPLRVSPLEDADLLYATLASWCTDHARRLGLRPPGTVQVYFDADVDVRGIPAGWSPEQAFSLGRSVCGFLAKHHELIAHLPHAGIYHDDLVDLVGRLRSRYRLNQPTARRYRPRPCPLCGEVRVLVHWPTEPGQEIVVKCDYCWHQIPLPESLALI
jgi:hypothetical protein